jgi:DNA-binding SARP family transcriptional activator
MEFRILGPLEVIERGRPLELGGSRQRALLALLLTHANEVVSTDRLIDELWGARPPKTAPNALQYHVSRLRKALGRDDAIVTRQPGYLICVEPDELDLLRFERLVEEAQRSQSERAARLLRDALRLWRGPALADVADEPFAREEARRLEELRLAALERRLDAELELGGGAGLVGELEALVREHPLREAFRAQLMLALYRSGRQAEALDVYRETRRLLVEELGVEPCPALQELEQAILRQDPGLDPAGAPRAQATGSILAVLGEAEPLEDLLAIAEPIARELPRELILARLLGEDGAVAAATAGLAEAREALGERGVACRVAAFTTREPGQEAVRLAIRHDAELLLVPAPREVLASGRIDQRLTAILEQAPCDVGVLAPASQPGAGPVATPFGGVDHDWSAIEVAARLAASLGTTLRLLGTEADAARGRRDASRLLARASMLVQEVIGIVTEPVLVPAGQDGVLEATRDARLLVIGLSDRWQAEGIGSARLAVATGSPVPTLFVRRGARPGGVVPSETATRFTWTLAPEGA